MLADSDGRIVRLWTSVPKNANTLRALRKYFPFAEVRVGNMLRLGGFKNLVEAVSPLAAAKMGSSSPFIQALHLVEGPEDEGMMTIRRAGLLGG